MLIKNIIDDNMASEGKKGNCKMNTIGERIRKRRLEIGLSQDELAKKVGYTSRSTINKIENGTNDITQSMVWKMAEALDTPVSYLMGWDGIERLTAYEKRLLEAVRKADPITKQMLDRVLDLKTEIPVLPTRGNLPHNSTK